MNSEKRHSGSEVLNRIIAFDQAERAIWPVEEIRRVLRIQLGTRVRLALERAGIRPRRAVLALADHAHPPIRSVADLLYHPQPPVQLLNSLKELAKDKREDPLSDSPPEVAVALYYAGIAAALTRCGERITTLRDDELRAGLNWVAKQTWLDDRLHGLIIRALTHLRLGRHLWRRT